MKSPKPSLKYVRIGLSCCGDDWVQTESSRYDLERLGCIPAEKIETANLLVIQGTLNEKLKLEAEKLYAAMVAPKYILAAGTCACGGGLFPLEISSALPISVYVTGCPPRPEALMNGVISLRRIQGKETEEAPLKRQVTLMETEAATLPEVES